jgi:hypothetical protein
LKRSYFDVARRNLLEAKAEQVDLFSQDAQVSQ